MSPATKAKWRKLASLVHACKPKQADLDQLHRDWKAGKYDPTTGTYNA